MLEGVLKARMLSSSSEVKPSFNPWYVGGGVKRGMAMIYGRPGVGFNPWYVGGGVKRGLPEDVRWAG